MVLWSAFLPDVLPHVHGCPNAIAEHELLRAAQEFFGRTRAWQVNLPALPVVAATPDVGITISGTEQELVRVESAWLDGVRMEIHTATALDDAFSDNWQSHTGTPSALVQIAPGTAMLYPSPTANAVTGLVCRVAVRPKETATGIPDDMAARFREAIISGAKALLMLYPSKSWSSTDLAAVNGMRFESAVSAATLAAATSYGRGRIAASPGWC